MPRTPSGLDVIEEDVVEVQSCMRRRFKMIVFSVIWYGLLVYICGTCLLRGPVDVVHTSYLILFFCTYFILLFSIFVQIIIIHDRMDLVRLCLTGCVKARVDIAIHATYYAIVTGLFGYTTSIVHSWWLLASIFAYVMALVLPLLVYLYRLRVRSRVREIVEADMA